MKLHLLVIWIFTLPIFFNSEFPFLTNNTHNRSLGNFDPCTEGNLGGNAWIDFDADGIQDSNEIGAVEGVLIEIYDANDVLVGTDATDVNGDWQIDPTGFSFPIRVEFSQIPSWAFWTLNGTNSPTSVQFIPAASCAIDIGLGDCTNYCESNPTMVTTCYVQSSASDLDVVVSFSYDNEGTAAQDKATVTHSQQGGSLWGLAYDKALKTMYTAAVLKRHIPLGPEGLDAIYTIDPFSGTPNATPWLELTDDLGIAVSSIAAEPQYHTNTDRDLNVLSQNDPDAYLDVGKVGIGDIEISADGQTLYVVNLHDKTLYAINTVTKTVTGSFPIPDPGCSNGEVRPWALGRNNGDVFVGVTCDGSASGNPANLSDDSGVNNLSASVYRLDGTSFTQVLNFPLDYPREVPFQYGIGCDFINHWKPWLSVMPATCNDGNIAYPTPLLSDIEFADNGDMILGFLDRTGLQFGNHNFGPTGSTNHSLFAAGDILRACKAGSNWTIESTASGCSSPGGLAINTFDPNGYYTADDILAKHGEFYEGDYFHGNGNFDGTGLSYFPGHPEITIGGLAVIPGTNEVMSTSYDPVTGGLNFSTGGVITLDNTTGQRSRNGYQLYATNAPGTTQGKGVGLGDLEALCVAPPIQIGNYVWLDDDEDGIQDPNEMGIPNINVSLYGIQGGVITQIATTTTNADGFYYFTDYEQYGMGYDTLTPGNNYFIAVGENGQFDTSTDILTIGGNEYELTVQNTGQGTNPDINDSDAFLIMDNTIIFNGFPVDTITIGSVGFVDHTLDFGFIPSMPPTTTPPITPPTDTCSASVCLPVTVIIKRG